MSDVYSFVHEADPLKNIESQKQILALMAQQTTECAYFIRDYAKNKNFCTSLFGWHTLATHIICFRDANSK